MKLPISQELAGKRMTMTSGTSTGRKGVVCERRETSMVAGHAIRGVQFKANMDLGSGDTSEYFSDIQNNYDSLNWEARFDSHDFQPAQSTVTKTSNASAVPAKPLSSSSESITKRASVDFEVDRHDGDDFFKGKANQLGENKSATLAVVEDGKQPSFTANESNPTVPSPTEPSKTSTLRLSDRTRSGKDSFFKFKGHLLNAELTDRFCHFFRESEDDIEKMDEPEQDGTLTGHKTMYKTTPTTENSPNSEKIDKNGNRSDSDQNEADNDCVVQCLYYTIQCCECVIF